MVSKTFGLAALEALTALSLTAAPALAADLVTVTTKTLNDTTLKLPDDLPASRTLLLLAFHHADLAQLAQWEAGMALTPAQDNWLEIPVVGITNPILRHIILSGMKGKTHSVAERNHRAPLFGDSFALARGFGVSGSQVTVLVVDRQGHIQARVEGGFDSAKARILRDALVAR